MKQTVQLSVFAFLIGSLALAAETPAPALERTGPKVVFLGDSITDGGGYIDYIETWFLLNKREKLPTFINLGLSSETVSGLSEAHHPFPRLYLHTRLKAVLKTAKPDVVVACYGMNCGIYHPFSEERFGKYKAGIRTLINDAKAAGARVVLMTPPPYAGKLSTKPEPADGIDFGYKTPYKEYDSVLARYAEWVLTLNEEEGVDVVDVRTPVLRHMEKSYGRDPIHPNGLGHEIMAEAFLKAWGENTGADTLETGESAHAGDGQWQAMIKLVKARRQAYDKTLREEIGHGHPGKKAKYSLEEAVKVAAGIDAEIAGLLGGR